MVLYPSFNKSFENLKYQIKPSFIILGSAHNIKEIRLKELQKVNAIFLSSIFKKNKNFLGLNKFKNISKISEKKIIALGGLSKSNIRLLKLTGSYGFAGISFFKKKGP